MDLHLKLQFQGCGSQRGDYHKTKFNVVMSGFIGLGSGWQKTNLLSTNGSFFIAIQYARQIQRCGINLRHHFLLPTITFTVKNRSNHDQLLNLPVAERLSIGNYIQISQKTSLHQNSLLGCLLQIEIKQCDGSDIAVQIKCNGSN